MRRPIVLFVALAGFIFASCSDSTSPPVATGNLHAPDTIRFSATRAGLYRDTTIVFSNTGSASLSISSQTFSSSSFLLVDSSQSKLTIAAGDAQNVRIRFQPKDSNAATGTDVIASNAGSKTIVLIGQGTALSRILLTNASVDFGTSRAGLCEDSMHGTPTTQDISIMNAGNDSLMISAVTSQSSDFVVTTVLPISIAPGANATINVRFCPSQAGATTGTLNLTSNATAGISSISVSGTGTSYIPYAGSLFTYDAAQLDANGNAIGQAQTTSIGVIASNLTYQGKTGVSLTSDSTYFKVEDNGDVSIYFAGFPTYPSSSVVDSGWFSLPTGSHQTFVRNKTTTFTDSSGKLVTLTTADTARYLGDTTLRVAGQQLTCHGILFSRFAIYSQGFNAMALVSYFQAAFSPSLGFTVLQGRVNDRVLVVNGNQQAPTGGGEERLLKSFILK